MKVYALLLMATLIAGLSHSARAVGAQTRPTAEPIIVDMNDDGYQLTSPADGVAFDVAGTGVRQQIGWTAATSDDAFLAIDENHNGVIDSGRELFAGVSGPPNGFAALTALSGFRSLDDLKAGRNRSSTGIVTSADAIFGLLLLWTDRNHDGISQESELESLAHAGFTKVYLGFEDVSQLDSFGNLFHYEGKASRKSTNSVEVLRRATAIRLRPATAR